MDPLDEWVQSLLTTGPATPESCRGESRIGGRPYQRSSGISSPACSKSSESRGEVHRVYPGRGDGVGLRGSALP